MDVDREHGEQAGEPIVDAGIDKLEAAVAYTDRLLGVEDPPRVEVSVDDGAARVDCDDAAVESVENQAAQATEAGRGVIRDSRLPAREGAIPFGTVPRTAFL